MSDFDKKYDCPVCHAENKLTRMEYYCEDCRKLLRVGILILDPEYYKWVLAALDNEGSPLITKEIAGKLRAIGGKE